MWGAVTPVDTLAQARAADGSGFRIERLNLGDVPRVRVVSIDLLGAERASAWVRSQNGGHVVLGLVGTQGSSAMLVASGGEAQLELNAHVPEAYLVHAVSGANVSQ